MSVDVTVSIEGLLDPTTLPLPEACTLLWQTLREQPLGAVQADSYHRLLGTGDTARVEQMLDEDGQLDLTVRLPEGRRASVRIWRGKWTTRAKTAAARYVPEQMPPEDGRPGLWGVRDLRDDVLVTDVEDEPLRYSTQSGADTWIRSEIYMVGARCGRP